MLASLLAAAATIGDALAATDADSPLYGDGALIAATCKHLAATIDVGA